MWRCLFFHRGMPFGMQQMRIPIHFYRFFFFSWGAEGVDFLFIFFFLFFNLHFYYQLKRDGKKMYHIISSFGFVYLFNHLAGVYISPESFQIWWNIFLYIFFNILYWLKYTSRLIKQRQIVPKWLVITSIRYHLFYGHLLIFFLSNTIQPTVYDNIYSFPKYFYQNRSTSCLKETPCTVCPTEMWFLFHLNPINLLD